MKTEKKALRAIISGGGSGGHIFPAISIAEGLKAANPDTEILFVGAEGRMEMEKIPAAGYRIIGLPVAGLQRRLTLANLALPFKILKSLRMAGKVIGSFRPDIAIGVGGYASAPLLWAASRRGIPTLIQEQNSFAGLANRILGKRAGCICTAYDGMERFFPADRIVLTGNPIRKDIVPADDGMRRAAMEFYGLDPQKRHIFIVGGSLGSRTLNRSVMGWIEAGCPGGEDVEIIWQCGKYYKAETDKFMEGHDRCRKPEIRHYSFIARMDLAYAAADVVVSRSGASSVSELCAAHKAVIFGVGSLGAALLQDTGLAQYGMNVIAGFDVDKQLVGTHINGIPVYDVADFPRLQPQLGACIGILTVPVDRAQEACNDMIAGGVRAIWNFTPYRIKTPDDIVVQNTSIYAHLAVMFNRLNHTLGK